MKKFVIYGQLEAIFDKYDKHGNIKKGSRKYRNVDSIAAFYTVLEPNIDFISEIEEHSPIMVKLLDC